MNYCGYKVIAVAKLNKVDLQRFCLYLYKTPVQMEGCFAY